ncbi:MAG: hypothetical protein LUD79_01065 [Oscillospiraceae bacterium]|nr:hypothetical protein [Oscillospiraceae bacterium]
MKHRVMIVPLICLTMLLGACSRTSEMTDEKIDQINQEETYASGMTSLAVIVDSMDELYEMAEAIADVQVLSTETVDVDGFPQTVSTVKVLNAYVGDMQEGDMIYIREEGGELNGSTYSVGVPTLQEEDHALLFLIDSGLGNEDEYCIVGAYQGKFIEKEGYYFQQATEDVKLDASEYYPQNEVGMENLLQELTE